MKVRFILKEEILFYKDEFTGDDEINLKDFIVFAENWLAGIEYY